MNLDEVVEGNKEYMEGIRKMVASQNGHKTKLHWIPAFQEYQLICTGCGENITLKHGLEISQLVIDVDGECEPGEVLGINVRDGVGVKDHFGGA